MNIDACREESGVNDLGEFLRSGFGSSKVVGDIEENMLSVFRVVAVYFIANIRGTDENAGVIFLEGRIAANSGSVGSLIVKCLHGNFPHGGLPERGTGLVAFTLHEIALAVMTEFIGGDEISIRVTGPFTFATRFAAYVADVKGFSGGGSMWDGIVITRNIGRGSDSERFAYALKWEKIPCEVARRALSYGGSGKGSHL